MLPWLLLPPFGTHLLLVFRSYAACRRALWRESCFGGWIALPGIALGLADVPQAICFAPGWPSLKPFWVGLLPSFAALTLVILLDLAPDRI